MNTSREPAEAKKGDRTGSRYLVRFDDLCPTMNWAVWDEIEAAMVRLGIRPILAVVPDNRDPKLQVGPPLPEFWDRVRRWQDLGWTIALHGYQHLYENRSPGIIGLTPQSEFAGLPQPVQEEKLRKGLALFQAQGIRTRTWVAPAHSFDHATVASLIGLGIEVISDGLWPRPFRDRSGMFWLPQQLWGFQARPAGTWTVCLHPNGWSRQDLDLFLASLEAYRTRMTSLAEVLDRDGHRTRTLGDRVSAWLLLNWGHGLRPRLSSILRRILPMPARRP